MEIMTPKHPLWNDFMNNLSDACKKTDEKGKDGWFCDGTLKNARQVLMNMEQFDVEMSLAYFEDHGGFCDCEIGLNVYDEDL